MLIHRRKDRVVQDWRYRSKFWFEARVKVRYSDGSSKRVATLTGWHWKQPTQLALMQQLKFHDHLPLTDAESVTFELDRAIAPIKWLRRIGINPWRWGYGSLLAANNVDYFHCDPKRISKRC